MPHRIKMRTETAAPVSTIGAALLLYAAGAGYPEHGRNRTSGNYFDEFQNTP